MRIPKGSLPTDCALCGTSDTHTSFGNKYSSPAEPKSTRISLRPKFSTSLMNVPCRGKTTPVFRDRIGIVVRSESPVFIAVMFNSRLSARPIGKKYPDYPLVFFKLIEWRRNAFVTCVESFDQKVELDAIVSAARARNAK